MSLSDHWTLTRPRDSLTQQDWETRGGSSLSGAPVYGLLGTLLAEFFFWPFFRNIIVLASDTFHWSWMIVAHLRLRQAVAYPTR